MRTVICHFYNEEYLLPWWLKHHLSLFDYGILIDHGSTDRSADICRELAPHWRLVRSRLSHFDAYLTDLEVMNYEQEMVGWKIALCVTEFLVCSVPLDNLEYNLKQMGRSVCAASGMLVIDDDPEIVPTYDKPLPLQKFHGLDDNALTDVNERIAIGNIGGQPTRNRLYHCNPVGMYTPGRHSSHMPDSGFRLLNLRVLVYHYSPWTPETIARKMQIGKKLDPKDVARGWGTHHLRDAETLQGDYLRKKLLSKNFMEDEHCGDAITLTCRY